jgi:hypothetical protein
VENHIQLGVLAPGGNDLLFGYQAVSAGWGIANDGLSSVFLLTATLRFLNNDECVAKIERVGGQRVTVHSRYVCTVAYPQVILQPVSTYLVKYLVFMIFVIFMIYFHLLSYTCSS